MPKNTLWNLSKNDRLERFDTLIYVEIKALPNDESGTRKFRFINFYQSEDIVLIGAITRKYLLYFETRLREYKCDSPWITWTVQETSKDKEGVVIPSSSRKEDQL